MMEIGWNLFFIFVCTCCAVYTGHDIFVNGNTELLVISGFVLNLIGASLNLVAIIKNA